MTKTFFVLVFFVLATTLKAQKNTHLGIEAALTHDVYELIDEGSLLKKGLLATGYFGLSLRQDLNSKTFLEAGLLRKFYNEGIGFTPFSGYTQGNAINAWLLPLRLGTRINLHRQRIYLVPVTGFTLGSNSDYGYGDGGFGGYEISATDTIYHTGHSKLSLRKTFPLLQSGLGMEFMLLRTVLVSVAANYYTGFTNVIEQKFDYTHNSKPYKGSGLSKGEMLSFGVALKYPVSTFWLH